MLPDQSWNCAGWHVWQVSGSISAVCESVAVPDPEPQPPIAAIPAVTKATAGSTFITFRYEVCSPAPRVSQFDREPATAFEGRFSGARAGVIRVPEVGRRVRAAAGGGLSGRRWPQLRGRRAPDLPCRL